MPVAGDAVAMARCTPNRFAPEMSHIETTDCEFCDHAEQTNDPDGCVLGHAPRTTGAK